MKDCPQCGRPVDGASCGACGYGDGGNSAGLSEWGKIAQATAQHFRAPENQPSSWSLTDQQWYNVCKFRPSIARRCARPMPEVGPEHPLDRTATMGPLLAKHWGAPPARDREPGEDG